MTLVLLFCSFCTWRKETQRLSNNLPKVIQLLKAELRLKEVVLSWEGRPALPLGEGRGRGDSLAHGCPSHRQETWTRVSAQLLINRVTWAESCGLLEPWSLQQQLGDDKACPTSLVGNT